MSLTKQQFDQMCAEADRHADRLERRNTARQIILEEAKTGFYPAYPPDQLLKLGVSNAYLRRLCDELAAKGVLSKRHEDGYNSEKGRENGLVCYELNQNRRED